MPTQRILAVIALLASPFLVGAACTKDTKAKVDTGAVEAIDRAGSNGPGAAAAIDKTPLPGVPLDKLDAKKQDAFYKLIGTLTSPCGKSHSLRTSFTSDTSCRRAPFAVALIAAMLEDEATVPDVKEMYNDKYQSKATPKTFVLDDTPHVGATDSPVVLVEFFDYACPACQQFKPQIDQVIAEHGKDLVIYYKQFPLTSKHPDSHSAAQAAIAAYRQDKFQPMHDLLFKNAPRHKLADTIAYAKSLGLDLPTFEADYAAASAKVDADQKQGDDAGVDHTPTLYMNGVEYNGPHLAKYLAMWIEEEVAVNR